MKRLNLRNRLQSMRDFLDWWFEGLLLLLPPTARRYLFAEPDLFTIEVLEASLLFRGQSGTGDPSIDSFDARRGTAASRPELGRWLAHVSQRPTRCVLLLPSAAVLRRTVFLPEGAKADLREIIGLEMDRFTPFPAEEVYYDCRPGVPEEGQTRFPFELFVIRRGVLDSLLAELDALGVRPAAISVAENADACDLLPAPWRPATRHAVQERTYLLAWIAAGMTAFSLYLPPVLDFRRLSVLEDEVSALRNDALTARRLLDERDALLQNSQYLVAQRTEHPPLIGILRELTEVLPDDTWVSRLTIRGREIQLQGESTAAAALIQRLEGSPILENAQFRSPVTKSQQSRMDRFQASVNIAEGKHVEAAL